MSGTPFANVNNIHSMIPEDKTKSNYTMKKYMATFYSRHTGT